MKTKQLLSGITLTILLIFSISSCNDKNRLIDSKLLADTDRFYSALSAEKGMNVAFLAMFDSAGVLLRSNHQPIEGYEAIKTLLMSQSDSTFTLTWEPIFAKIASSGDMGYTYGTYKITDKATDSISGEGTYSTIWRRSDDGKWKAMLDTGNPGLGKLKE